MDSPLLLTIITSIIAPLVTAYFGYQLAIKKAKRDYHNKALQNRYYLIYSPLRNLLLETHITGASLGFFLSQRIKRAWPYFRKLRIKEGFKRLDAKYGSNPSYEVEFGSGFPLEEIKTVLRKDGEWADSELLNLVQAADRSSYESIYYSSGNISNLLENEKFELAQHIWKSFEKLNKRLLPPT